MKYGIDLSYDISSEALDDICTTVLHTGYFDALEFYYGLDMVDDDFSAFLPKIAGIAETYDLEVVLHLPMYDLAVKSKRIKRAILDEIAEAMEFAGSLHCKKVITHGGSMGNVSSNHLTRQEHHEVRLSQQKLVAHMLQEICGIAEDFDILVCLENMFSDFLVGTHSKDLLLIKSLVRKDNLKFNYDTGHGNLIDENPSDFINALKKDLFHTHFHDNDGRFDSHDYVGAGTVPWYHIMETLISINYDHIIMFETKNRSSHRLLAMYEQIRRMEDEILSKSQ